MTIDPNKLDEPPVPAVPLDDVFGDGLPEPDESLYPKAMTASQWRHSGLRCPWEPILEPQESEGVNDEND